MREMNEQADNNQNSRVKLKQRVAGGAVLLIVLAIFLPFIFNHTRHEAMTAPVDITVNAIAEQPAQQPAEQAVAQPEQQPTDSNGVAPVQSMSSDQPGLTPSQNEAAAPVAESAPESLPAPAASVSPSLSQEPAASVQPQDIPAPARQLPAPAPAVKAQPAPRGHWVLQVGSFTQAEYAQQLAAKLRARGFAAYTQGEQNQLTRVYVGPLASQQQAQKIQRQVQNEFQLNGLVREKP